MTYYRRKTVAIDSGKYAQKMYWGENKLLFENKVEEISAKSPVYHTIVEFNGKLYSSATWLMKIAFSLHIKSKRGFANRSLSALYFSTNSLILLVFNSCITIHL